MFDEGYENKLEMAANQNIKEKKFWLKKLSGDLVKVNFPYDHRKIDRNINAFANLEFTLPIELFKRLSKLCGGSDYSLNAVLMSALIALLNKYTRENDIIVGAPIYHQDVEAGFINKVLILRNRLQENTSFKELLMQVMQTIVEATENYRFPAEKLPELLDIPFSKDDDFPLFDIDILLRNIHNENDIRNVKTNMTLSFINTAETIRGTCSYNSLLYRETTIHRIISHFTALLEKGISDTDTSISHIDIISPEEKRQLLVEFNDTAVEFPNKKTIHQRFEEQVEQTPENNAVVFENHRLTYQELNEKSNRLARVLRNKGVKPGSIVGIIVQHSIEMVTGILGILKAGGAYLPLDPANPRNRIRAMLDNSKTSIILTLSNVLQIHSFTNLQGLGSMREHLHVTGPRPQIKDLDHLPIPNRSLVDYEKYSQYIGMAMGKHNFALQTTRGCPYHCIYCHKIWPKTHVLRTAENIFAELKMFYDMGVRRFVLFDDIFNLDVENSSTFFHMIINNGLKVQLYFENGLRGDILTRDYIDLMVKAGAINVTLALETGSPRLQKLTRKHLNIEKFRKNTEYFCKNHPHVVLDLSTMHGFPSETKEEALMTLDILMSLKWVHFPYIHILHIFPNTDMEKLALENGITAEALSRSHELAFHELPDTLPFEKSFTLEFQSRFLNEYFLSKERLLHVLPHQMRAFSEDELLQKYNSYLPFNFTKFSDLLEFLQIQVDELSVKQGLDEDCFAVTGLNEKLSRTFPAKEADEDALKVLLLDLSQFFSAGQEISEDVARSRNVYEVVEPPLGLMYLLTYLDHRLGTKVNGKIAKSMIDFDNNTSLKALLDEFKPDVIGVRTLTYYKEFYHKTIAMIRHWGFQGPVIAGGPYATSDYTTLLKDRNIDLAVMGEGEITFYELIDKIMKNNGKLPGDQVLKDIQGIVFLPRENPLGVSNTREVIVLDEFSQVTANHSGENPEPAAQTDDLAYCIYTSGSTGQPKGVLIEHRSLINLCDWHNSYYSVTPRDRGTKYAGFGFDASVWEIFPYLTAGAAIYVIHDELKLDLVKLNTYFEENEISISFLPTQIGEQFMKLDNRSLRLLLVGGDKLRKYVKTRYGLVNNYGPTENAVVATSCFVEADDDNIPIGKPIANTQLYILDKNLLLQPIGAPGELCISGHQLAREYLDNPELTNEKFVENPYLPGERMYKTGDLTRWRPDGNIEFLGRIDNQTKIRGYRIEIGEIESCLMDHEDIQNAVVLEFNKEEKFLCAYIVSDSELEISELRDFLSRELPAYMIPTYFHQLDRIPLTSSGKVDRKKLKSPETLMTGGSKAPRTELEEKLLQVWKEVLGVENIGIADNFFEVGGDSIKVIQISARLNKYNLELKNSDIFANPTIEQLGKYIKNRNLVIDQGIVSGIVEKTPIQQWLFDNNFTGIHHFNQSAVVYKEDGFNVEIIKKLFTKLIQHHDALRMVYEFKGNKVVQRNRPLEGKLFHLETIDLSGIDNFEAKIEEHAGKIQQSIDLTAGPLVKLGLFKTAAWDHLLVVIHHLVIDGISWRILIEDFETAYRQLEIGEEVVLPLKTLSFKNWALQLKEYAQTKQAKKELDYWDNVENTKITPLPKDYQIDPGKKKTKYTKVVTITLGEDETETLLKKANWAYSTDIKDLLLTALGTTFKQWTGQEKILINFEGHGREDIFPDIDISRTVGWFTTQYPVILDMSETQDISSCIISVKETQRHIPGRGIGYGILRSPAPKPQGDSGPPLAKPEVSFNYIGQFGQENQSEFIKISPIKAGENIGPEFERIYSLEINGVLTDQKLSLFFGYNTHEYKESSIQGLADAYLANLIHIIRHCSEKKEKQLSPSDFGYKKLSIADLKRTSDFITLHIDPHLQIKDIYRLTPIQSGILYHSLQHKTSLAYLEQFEYTIEGHLDKAFLETALNSLFQRYDILRTIFISEGFLKPLQVVLKERFTQISYEDISLLNEAEKISYVEEFKKKDLENGFDPARDVLMRMTQLKTGENSYKLIWDCHHILMDGWCLGIIFKELFDIYRASIQDKPVQLAPVVPYGNYIGWLDMQDEEDGLAYWASYLKDYQQPAGLPKMQEYPTIDSDVEAEMLRFPIQAAILENLKHMAKENQVTLATLFQTIWGVLLQKYNHCRDVVFGTIVVGRPSEVEGIERMVGLFINAVPVRIKSGEDQTFSALLREVHLNGVLSKPYEYLPLAKIQSGTVLKTNLINHLMVYEDYLIEDELDDDTVEQELGFKIRDRKARVQTNYHLNVGIIPGENFDFKIGFNRLVYDPVMLKKVGMHYLEIIKQVVENSHITIKEMEVSHDFLAADSNISDKALDEWVLE